MDRDPESLAPDLPAIQKNPRWEKGPLSFTGGHRSFRLRTLRLRAVKPASLAAVGHCPGVSCNGKTEDYWGI